MAKVSQRGGAGNLLRMRTLDQFNPYAFVRSSVVFAHSVSWLTHGAIEDDSPNRSNGSPETVIAG